MSDVEPEPEPEPEPAPEGGLEATPKDGLDPEGRPKVERRSRADKGEGTPLPAGSLYQRAGGAGSFEALVARFYEGVAVDPVLRPLYPDEDLGAARERLTAFLVQLAGGPRRYEALRGEPRLRLRHLAFPIGQSEAAAWLARMDAALQLTVLPGEVEAELRTYFARTAAFLVNEGGLSLRGGTSAGPRGAPGARSGGDRGSGGSAGGSAEEEA